jgi:hypothetical protein
MSVSKSFKSQTKTQAMVQSIAVWTHQRATRASSPTYLEKLVQLIPSQTGVSEDPQMAGEMDPMTEFSN